MGSEWVYACTEGGVAVGMFGHVQVNSPLFACCGCSFPFVCAVCCVTPTTWSAVIFYHNVLLKAAATHMV